MTISLPVPVQLALEKLNTAGFEAYVVGGCVRDSLLGEKPEDWDITTNALPQQVMAVFSSYRTVPTGLSHGTVTLLLDDMALEITTYRTEGTYSDHRRPDQVHFTASLQDDLSRRDFTINALAYHPDVGIIDYFSGMADLEARRLVCVGDPLARFSEDALRILRALRFAATHDLCLEKNTGKALVQLAPLLRRISAERISSELSKLLCGSGCDRVLLAYPSVFSVVLPELAPMVGLQQSNPYHYLTVYEHTVQTVHAVSPNLVLRLTMLFHDCGKPQSYTRDEFGVDHFHGHAPVGAAIAGRALKRLHFDRRTIDSVCFLVLHHDDDLSTTDAALKRMLNRMGPEMALALIEVKKADVCGQHPDKRDRLFHLDEVKKRLHELIDTEACFSLDRLAINGEDLLKIGFTSGPNLGNVLHHLLDMVIDGECPNETSALLQAAQKLR